MHQNCYVAIAVVKLCNYRCSLLVQYRSNRFSVSRLRNSTSFNCSTIAISHDKSRCFYCNFCCSLKLSTSYPLVCYKTGGYYPSPGFRCNAIMWWGEVGNFGECELKMVSSASEWGNKVNSSSMRENMLEDFTGHWRGRPQERADLFGSWSPLHIACLL
jgi:hypothetical protein